MSGSTYMQDRIIRPKEYRALLGGISTTTFWRMEQRGELAPRRQISQGIHGYLYSEAIARIKSV